MPMSAADAAKTLGIKEREVASVEECAYGDVVTDTAGSRILMHETGPHWYGYDKAPNTGLPLWVDPSSDEDDAPEPAGEREDPGAEPSGGGDAAGVEPVPDDTAAKVIEWVNGHPDRAVRALEAERARETPRTTLVAALEKLAG